MQLSCCVCLFRAAQSAATLASSRKQLLSLTQPLTGPNVIHRLLWCHTVTFPLDITKTRLQIQNLRSSDAKPVGSTEAHLPLLAQCLLLHSYPPLQLHGSGECLRRRQGLFGKRVRAVSGAACLRLCCGTWSTQV